MMKSGKDNKMENRAKNPLLPPCWYIPDGECRCINGELFLYGSCDKVREHYCSDEYYVAHTKDFVDWRISGPSFKLEDVVWEERRDKGRCFTEERFLYAPDAVWKNGKTYLYMCLSDNTEGVAVSDSPSGPFTDARQMITNKTRTPIKGIDPAVFIDDDGQGYYYWGQFHAKAAKLTADMMQIDEESIVENILTEEEHYFHEGSSMRKRGDTYYYVFADISRGKPTCLGYATGKSPLGPFQYQGVIVDNHNCDPGSWNNHGSIEEIDGKWYVFYHRSCGNSSSMRRACAEPISFDKNGLIPEVKVTSQGSGKPFALGEQIPGFTACEVSGNAYVSDNENGNALVVLKGEGGAIFRYVENRFPARQAEILSTGAGLIKIYADGRLVGKGNLGNRRVAVSLESGLHEISLLLSDTENVEIRSICFR